MRGMPVLYCGKQKHMIYRCNCIFYIAAQQTIWDQWPDWMGMAGGEDEMLRYDIIVNTAWSDECEQEADAQVAFLLADSLIQN
jgi:hypothetical protein